MRNAGEKDVDLILEIYDQGKKWMKDHGVDQWDQNYPGIWDIRKDMDNNEIFVFITDDSVYGVASLSCEKEDAYENPVKGQWEGVSRYGTIHRMAVLGKYRGTGISIDMMNKIKSYFAKRGIFRILVDTHMDNGWMIKYLEKNGFKRCTEIVTERNHPRIGFEFIDEKNLSFNK